MLITLTRRELNLLYRAYLASLPIEADFPPDAVAGARRKINPGLIPSNDRALVELDLKANELEVVQACFEVGTGHAFALDKPWLSRQAYDDIATKLLARQN